LKHENINKEEASVQEFIYYLVHMRDTISLDSITNFKFALAEQ